MQTVPGLGEGLEPGGDVDAIAEDVVAIDDDVAKIDTDPQLETAFGRHRVVDGTRCPLHLEGAVQRVDDARKIRQQAVACGADDPSAMRRDQRVDSAAEPSECLMRTRLILAHQAAEADHIRMQNGGEFPLPGRELPPDLEARTSRSAGVANRFDLAVDRSALYSSAALAGHGRLWTPMCAQGGRPCGAFLFLD